ncbi:MAG: SurA N-terminal domain-containing protein, partial [Myxococcota bacterium]|nr:SurA N-terminal domain-containing protein [Myxococcota bacterium]
MLESIRRGQRWLTLLLVAFVGAVFVFFMGVGGQPGGGTPSGKSVIELGDFRLDLRDYQRLRARQEQAFREQSGDNFDARAVAPFLDAQALRSLVDTVVLAQSAKELGLGVSREEIQSLVRQSTSFRDESGKFNVEAFNDYTEYEFGTQRNFIETVRRDLLSQKMVSLLYDQATLSETELTDSALYALEQVRFAYVALDSESLPPGEELSEEALQAYLADNNDTLKLRYEAEIDEYSESERVHAAHILIQVGPEASETATLEAREKAESARERILAGEEFAMVAAEVSEDPGSREEGGDLGIFARGVNAPEIDNAAFSLEAGGISEIVQSAFGFHLIQAMERLPARTRPFEEVVAEMAREDATAQAASDRATQLSEALLREIEAGMSLEEAAANLELRPNYAGPMQRRPDGFILGLGGAPDVLTAAFALDLETPTSKKAFQVGSSRVFLQVLDRSEPTDEEIESTVETFKAELLDAKRNRLVQEWLERQRSEFENRGELL